MGPCSRCLFAALGQAGQMWWRKEHQPDSVDDIVVLCGFGMLGYLRMFICPMFIQLLCSIFQKLSQSLSSMGCSKDWSRRREKMSRKWLEIQHHPGCLKPYNGISHLSTGPTGAGFLYPPYLKVCSFDQANNIFTYLNISSLPWLRPKPPFISLHVEPSIMLCSSHWTYLLVAGVHFRVPSGSIPYSKKTLPKYLKKW